ncbi:MAG: ArsR/SmtB family transcription factor [Candidatus Nanoarchaeia archaeon]
MEKEYKLFFGTLTSSIRLALINSLRKGPKTVSELQKENGLEQTSASHNLRRLERCGFVNVKKKGRYRIYSLNKKTIKPLMEIIDRHMDEHCRRIVAGKR